MSTESLKEQMQSRKKQQIASESLHFKNAQENSRFMSLPLRFDKKSIDLSKFPENAAIMVDELHELVAGGWFVNPAEYPNATSIMSFADFRQKAIVVRDCYEIIVRSAFNDIYEDIEIILPRA